MPHALPCGAANTAMAGRVPGRGAVARRDRPDSRRAIFVNGILAGGPDEDAPPAAKRDLDPQVVTTAPRPVGSSGCFGASCRGDGKDSDEPDGEGVRALSGRHLAGAGAHRGRDGGPADHRRGAPGDPEDFLSAIFGALFVALADPGGDYGPRVARLAIVGVGRRAAYRAGFRHRPQPLGMGGAGRLRGHLAGRAGGRIRRCTGSVAAYLLNVWFIIPGCRLCWPSLSAAVLPAWIHVELVAAGAGLASRAGVWVAYTLMLAAAGPGAAPSPRRIRGDISPRYADPADDPFARSEGRRR